MEATCLVEVDGKTALTLRRDRLEAVNSCEKSVANTEDGTLSRHEATNLGHKCNNADAFEVDGLRWKKAGSWMRQTDRIQTGEPRPPTFPEQLGPVTIAIAEDLSGARATSLGMNAPDDKASSWSGCRAPLTKNTLSATIVGRTYW